jgi:mono/diheme cytochrome c family protein
MRRAGLIAIAIAAATGCTRMEDALASIPFLSYMREAPFFDPYEAPRPAPGGSIPFESPVGEVLPPIEPSERGLVAFAAGPYGQNPFAGEPGLVELGKTMYDRFCLVCHGAEGRAGTTGPIVQKDPAEQKYPAVAPDLTQPVTVARPDGYLYGMIRVARGAIMPAYGARTTHRERWAIVGYVRQLQAAAAQPGGGS